MEQANKNERSRGELRLEKSELIENTILENSKPNNDGIPLYTVENSELDDLLGDATETQADKAQADKTEQSQEKQRKGQMLSTKKAAELALSGLQEFCNGISSYTGKNLAFGENFVKVFVAATTPVIQKYSRHIDLDTDNINLDSWTPELLALGSISAVGGSTFLQLRKQPSVVVTEDEKGGVNGDKP